MIELKNVELFKDLTTIEQNGIVLDLHNDFTCAIVDYDKNEKLLHIGFISNIDGGKICLRFEGVTIVKLNLIFNKIKDKSTINILYRGRFEIDGSLFEYSKLQESYFYMEFEEGDSFEFFTEKLLVEM